MRHACGSPPAAGGLLSISTTGSNRSRGPIAQAGKNLPPQPAKGHKQPDDRVLKQIYTEDFRV
jgi:hypothetical protein